MDPYARTAIRRLSIRGFRSIRSLELPEIPDLVVLHGPNGTGKSNLLLATQLVLRAAARPGELPIGREHAISLSLGQADKELGLRPDDFHYGAIPEIRVAVDVALGTQAVEMVRVPAGRQFARLALEIVVQLASDSELRYWFERADLDDSFSLGTSANPAMQALRQQLDNVRGQVERQRATLVEQEEVVAALDSQVTSSDVESRRAKASAHVKEQTESLRSLESRARHLEAQLDEPSFLAERIRSTLLPRLIQVSSAYRVPGGMNDPEKALYRAFLSDDRLQRDATRRLGRRLASVGLFGAGPDPVALLPVNNKYGEQRILLTHPTHGDLPLRNLGSGEQQVVYILAQSVITPFPIAQIEEPEAHLHPSLMEPIARVLRESVAGDAGTPDVDQLWIATHHHHFALALEYFDVQLVNGATTVSRLPRAKAAQHFYEPGPIWEALRQLASSAKTRDAVVFRGEDGSPVTAAQILDSIEKDPEQRVAMHYAKAMTEAMVLAMRQRAETTK
jgi:predicted ATPase